MAKGLGIIGNFSGKLGNSVGYIIRNAKSNQTQGIRIYQPTVRNPQTTLQLEQRVKLAAVSNIYKQFRDVIRRSIEGKEYGDESRRAWLKQALGSNFNAGPWLLKGSTEAWPIPNVRMSVGSLPDINTQLTPQDAGVVLEINRASDGAEVEVTTVGQLSDYLIYEGNVQAGDQVTILACYITASAVRWAPVSSFYVSTASSVLLESIGMVPVQFDEGDVSTTLRFNVGSDIANAVCLITSREGDGGKHLRNSAEFVFGTSALQALVYSGAYKSVAMDSYRQQSSQTADWEVTRGASGEDAITLKTRDGQKSVVIVSMTQVGGYLMAVADDGNQYYMYGQNSKWNNYNMWYTSLSSRGNTAPAGATQANTVADVSGATTAEQDAAGIVFANWFIRNGGSYAAIF